MTTSHELAHQLLDGPDVPMVQAKDPEGNNFYDVSEVGVYFVDSTESGQYDGVTSEEDLKDSYGEDYEPFVKKVIVLWP